MKRTVAATWPRLGDESAPRLKRLPVRPTIIVVSAIVSVIAVVTIATGIAAGNVLQLIGDSIGILFFVVVVVGFVGWWIRHWAPVRDAISSIRMLYPDSLTYGARLPEIAEQLSRQSWPKETNERLPRQEAALRVTNTALTVFAIQGKAINVLLEIPWDQVRDIFPVEFVDSSIAYEGVVIDGVEPGARLVVQLSEPAGRFLRYPTGSELAEVVARISSLRN